MCGTRNWNAVPVRGAPGCTTATVWQSARTGLAMHETGERVVSHVDGERSAAGRVEATVPMIFSAEETTDLGEDTGTSVSDDYAPGASSFNGRVKWVQIDIDEAAENADHFITPEERLRIAMARQ